jgi:hypothetical protein
LVEGILAEEGQRQMHLVYPRINHAAMTGGIDHNLLEAHDSLFGGKDTPFVLTVFVRTEERFRRE